MVQMGTMSICLKRGKSQGCSRHGCGSLLLEGMGYEKTRPGMSGLLSTGEGGGSSKQNPALDNKGGAQSMVHFTM